MLLLKFNYDDIKNCTSVTEVYKMFGIGKTEDDKDCSTNFTDEKVFGKRAYYRNIFIADETFQDILAVMEKVPNYRGRKNPKDRMSYAAMQWCNFSPMSSGPRFDKVKELVGGEINRSVVYILTPEDDMYEEDPTLGVR